MVRLLCFEAQWGNGGCCYRLASYPAQRLELPNQPHEPRLLTLGIRNRYGHDEQFIQARRQELIEARSNGGFVAGDDQVIDERIGHCPVGGDGEARVGEHSGVEREPPLTTELPAPTPPPSLPILPHRHPLCGAQ